jgi:glucokinase
MAPRTALVADIGGTNARFAIADLDTLTLTHFAAFPCARFSSPAAVIAAYLATTAERPPLAAIAVAGPVAGDSVHLTNLAWDIAREGIRTATGAEDVLLLNDFEALARSLPLLTDRDLRQVGGEAPVPHATKAVLGPGTGLGVAGLVWSAAGWVPVAGEGGHVTFPAETAEELAILDRVRGGPSSVSMERLLSGSGLGRLHAILSDRAEPPLPASEVTARALAGTDPAARKALDLFVAWLGRFAGDLALVYGAQGGVYLGGGIAPRIAGILASGRFRAAFQDKGRLRPYLAPIPTYVIIAPDAGLRGAAVARVSARTRAPLVQAVDRSS